MNVYDHVMSAAVLAALASFAIIVASRADETASTNALPAVDYVEGTDSTAALTTEIRSAAASLMGAESAASLLHAVGLTMRKYDMDMRGETGRRAWHGRLICETVSTNDFYKVSTYSNEVDGAVWTYRQTFKPVPVLKRSTRTVTAMTNGVPPRIAALRAKRAAQINAGAVTTNIIVNVGD